MYYTNVSETMQQQLEEQGSSISQLNEWHGYFSRGIGLSFINNKRFNLFIEVSNDKCFKRALHFGLAWRF